ncbi:MAG TPA: Nramp family divalent metal transporter [Candidatus Limnocylindria bacterium]|nr:Nramp family divalent metal transporter [Candidatus Limnocylindria bacterium]
MPERPSVKAVARQAGAGARQAVGRVGRGRGQGPPGPPRIGPLAHLLDRIEHREFLRLRGRFRGRRGLIAFLAVMGPGLIAGIAGNDAGGITTYSVLGARTGLALLWVFPITIAILAVVQEMVARLGVVTGQGLSDLIRDRFGVRWTVFAMAVLLIANVANTVAEFAGASLALGIFGVPQIVVVPVVAAAIWALVLFASYRTVERIFLSVSLVFVTYIASAVLAHPDWGQVGRALVTPRLDVSAEVLLLLVAVVGTTITPYMQFYLQSAVAEKGIDEEELRLEQADAIGGAIWTNVIAIFIVVATASTVFGHGQIETAADAARALEPVAGQFAEVLFAVGLFGASVLAATIMPISTAFVICEAFGWESGVGKRFSDARAFFGIYTFVLVAGALIVLLPGLGLTGLIVGSQNLQGLLLPVVLVFLVLLVNDRAIMGRHANGRLGNVVAWTAVGLVVVLDAVLIVVTVLGGLGVRLG